MSNPINLPQEFIDKWNTLASDYHVSSMEVDELKKMSAKTKSSEDDAFLKELESYTTEVPTDLDESLKGMKEICNFQYAASSSGLNVSNVTVEFTSIQETPRQIIFGPVSSSTAYYSYCSTNIKSAKTGNNEDDNLKLHMQLGYRFEDDPGSHGLNVGLMFAPWSSEYFYPSIEAELNATFDSLGISGGGGVGLNVGLADVVNASVKMTAMGHETSIGDEWQSGWSANVVAGLKLFIFYVDASFPITGDGVHPSYSIDAGLRLNLLGMINGK